MTFDTMGNGFGATNYRQIPNGSVDIFGGPYTIPTPSGMLKKNLFNLQMVLENFLTLLFTLYF